MRRRLTRMSSLLLLLAIMPSPPPVHATTIDPLVWEQMVADAAFVGIVECETAGGIIARYRVVESWKGVATGTQFTMRVATNYWGPQFPVTLAGERYLATAYKSDVPMRIMSTTSGAPVPLWWRDIPFEYALPLWQGRVRLPIAEGETPLGELGSEHKDLESFKRDALALLALGAEEREVRLLQRLSRKYLFGERDEGKEKLPPALAALKPKVMSASSATEIVNSLLAFGRTDPKKYGYSVGTVLLQAGGAATLRILESVPSGGLPIEPGYQRYVMSGLRGRLGLPAAEESLRGGEDQEKPPTAAELSEARRVLAGNPTEEQFHEFFEMMMRHDPAPVAAYLARWKNPGRGWQDANYGYVLGSYFAWRCGRDRERNLRTLLTAHDPLIRVAGAIYLCYEDEEGGMTELRKLTGLAGEAGTWAALNLARRGDKSAVARAFDAFATAGDINMAGELHRQLQDRLIVLLSNGARASNLPKPPDAAEHYYKSEAEARAVRQRAYKELSAWWDANKDRITLADPWLPLLKEQKVD